MTVSGEKELISLILSLTEEKNEYEKIKDAFSSVQQKGYGVVMPQLSDIRMEEPVLIAHGNKFGVKMKAISPSIHMIRANIETEIAPIVGSREQAEDLIDYIKNGENSDSGVWKTNIFGKSVGDSPTATEPSLPSLNAARGGLGNLPIRNSREKMRVIVE